MTYSSPEVSLFREFGEAARRREGLAPPIKTPRGALLDFCRRRSVPRWVEGDHLALIAEAVQRAVVAAASGHGLKIIIEAPPRHGKTHLTSVMSPCWAMGTFKDFPVILASYGAKLAYSKAREARNLMERVGKAEFDVTVDQGTRAISDWQLLGLRGRMLAAGVGGPLTGEGALLGIIDDPFKNFREAHSETIREMVWNWYRTVFATRIESGGSQIVTMTRWHERDLIGKLLEEFGRKGVDKGGEWEVITLRARNETAADVKSDPLKRPKDRPLWPVRWDSKALDERKRTLGNYAYSALFQQRPQPEGTALFRRHNFRYAKMGTDPRDGKPVYELGFVETVEGRTAMEVERVRVSDCWVIMTADTALSQDKKADYTVVEAWAITPPVRGRRRRILILVLREHLEAPDQIPLLRRTWKSTHARWVGIEKAQAGLAAVQHAQREGMPVKPCPADADKVVRALPLSAAYEAHDVFHLYGAEWLPEYEAEVLPFPNVEHDDQVDAAAYMELLLQLVPTPRVYVADTKRLAKRLEARAERVRKKAAERNGGNGGPEPPPATSLEQAAGLPIHMLSPRRFTPPQRREDRLSD